KRSKEAFLNHNRLFAEKEKQLQSLRTRLDQLKFELKNKEKEVNVAEANNDVLRNLYGELLEENQSLKSQLQSYDNKFKQLESEIEKKIEFDHKATLSQIEYELRMKTEELDVGEANITSLSNLLKELHIEKDIKRSQQASLNHREANTDVVRKLFGESFIEQGVLVEENQSLKSQFQSYENKLKQLEYEVETETKANIIDLKEDLEDDILEYDQLLEETKILRSQLEWEIVTDSQGSQQD
ncbi:PREDICTED: synaptonemal complex, partial [Prunus dulcis]